MWVRPPPPAPCFPRNELIRYAPEGYWYALATFSRNLEIHTGFTKQIGLLTDAYSRLGVSMRSEIDTYDAVLEMLDKMGRLPGRRVRIVIGSGIDTFSEHNMDDVVREGWR